MNTSTGAELDKTETFIIGILVFTAPTAALRKAHRNHLILQRQTAHTHGRCEIDITAFHVADIVAREAFGDCRFARARLVKFRLVF